MISNIVWALALLAGSRHAIEVPDERRQMLQSQLVLTATEDTCVEVYTELPPFDNPPLDADIALAVASGESDPTATVALLKFAVPATLTQSSVARATLRLFVHYAYPGGGGRAPEAVVAAISQPWHGHDVISSRVPKTEDALIASAEPQAHVNGWAQWDVTSWFWEWLNYKREYGLSIWANGDDAHQASYGFSSLEGDHPPELVIQMGTSQMPVYLPALLLTSTPNRLLTQ